MNYPGEGPPSPPLQSPARRDPQLQGPRPTPLKVSKTSHQIRKPPPHPHLHHRPPPPPPQHPQELAGEDSLRRDPVIIYTVSPKIINATAGEFMSIVQRLTGPNPPSPCAGDVSPAARLATIEKTSPSESSRADWVVEVGQFPPGVLSPAPDSLPAVPAGFFSAAPDPNAHSWASDLGSPMWHNIFVASPSSNLLVSPGPPSSSYFDIFNLFDF